MNDLIAKLYDQAIVLGANGNYVAGELDPVKFAELIIRECMSINNVETIALDLPDYNLGVIEGYRRARENISMHFGVEE